MNEERPRISSTPQPAQRHDGPKATRPFPFVCAHEIKVLMPSTNLFDSLFFLLKSRSADQPAAALIFTVTFYLRLPRPL